MKRRFVLAALPAALVTLTAATKPKKSTTTTHNAVWRNMYRSISFSTLHTDRPAFAKRSRSSCQALNQLRTMVRTQKK